MNTALKQDPIRDFVLNGTPPPGAAPVQTAKNNTRHSKMGPLDHCVTAESSSTGRVQGTVTLFGALSFAVNLETTHRQAPISRQSYRVDQTRRTFQQNHEHDLHIALEDYEASAARSYADFATLCQEQYKELIGTIQRIQQDLTTSEIVESHCNEWNSRIAPHGELSDEDKMVFASSLATKVTDELRPYIEAASKQRRKQALLDHRQSTDPSASSDED